MTKNSKIFLWAVTLLLVGGAAAFLWKTNFFAAARSLEGIRRYVESFSPCSQAVFFLLQVVSVLLAPIPSNITAAAGAVVFGIWPSFLLTWTAVVLGSYLVFRLTRLWGRDFARRFVSKKVSEKYLNLLSRKRDIFLSLVFLLPLFPDDLLCILAGLTDIKAGRFLIIVILFRPWGLLAACVLGGSALRIPLWLLLLAGLTGLAVFLLGLRYGDRIEKALLGRFRRS